MGSHHNNNKNKKSNALAFRSGSSDNRRETLAGEWEHVIECIYARMKAYYVVGNKVPLILADGKDQRGKWLGTVGLPEALNCAPAGALR